MRAEDVDQAVLTRFNLQLAGGNDRGDHRGVDPAWLEPRLTLFETWCAPTVRPQTGPHRPWVVFVDARTPDPAVARIRAAAGDGVLVEAVDGPLPVPQLRERVAALVPGGRDHLLTTRVDNDDALAPGLLDAVLAQADAGHDVFLNPTRGLQVAGTRVYASRDRSGPFLSLVERRRPGTPPLTAFGVPHRRAARTLPVRQLGGGPWWVQVVHGANLANRVDGVRVDGGRLRAVVPHLAHAQHGGDGSHDGGGRHPGDAGWPFWRDVATSAGRTTALRAARGARDLLEAVSTPRRAT